MCILKKQVAEIDGEPNMLFRKCRPYLLMNAELSTEADGVVVKDSQRRWSEKHLVSLCVCYRSACLQESIGPFTDKFAE
jgi:hypothetical protein